MDMYNNVGGQVPRPPVTSQPSPYANAFYGASSGILGAYGEKILGSSSEYVQSNVSSIPTLLLKLLCCFGYGINKIFIGELYGISLWCHLMQFFCLNNDFANHNSCRKFMKLLLNEISIIHVYSWSVGMLNYIHHEQFLKKNKMENFKSS